MTFVDCYAYGRMSSDDQSLSPEQQRREVEEYAKRNGYRIIRWYFDLGESASKGDERRLEYQQLLIDSNSQEAKAVICWATSRFTRNHPHEAAVGKRILMHNGMFLDTVKEGKIDWNTFEGVLKDTLFNLLDHRYSVDLGKDSLRGRRNTFLSGGYPYGRIPYGYDHLYLCGSERRQVKRGTKTKNLRGWIQSLAVVKPEAEIVLRIFTLYVNHDHTLCAIARQLNKDNIPGPGKGVDGKWTTQNVRTRLRCAAYVGISSVGNPKKQKRKAHNKLEPEQRMGDWTPLVARDLFDRAQAKLDANSGQPHEGKSGPLQGILRCGVCGQVLHKENPRRSDDPRGNQYRCGTTAKGLLTPCHRWTCYEADVMPVVLRELVRAVDEETILLLEAGPAEPGKISNREVLEKHLLSLEQRISQAADSFLDRSLSAAMRAALEKKVNELTEDVVDTKRRLAAIAVANSQGGFERFVQWWKEAREQLVWLGEDKGATALTVRFQDGQLVPNIARVNAQDGKHEELPGTIADGGKLRALLKKLKVSVKVYWRKYQRPEKLGRGRVKEWELDEARLSVEINCGESSGSNATGAGNTLIHVERLIRFAA